MALRDHFFIVYSTIFPDNLEAFRYAQQVLTPDHFPKGTPEEQLWIILMKYAQKYGGIPSEEWLRDLFDKVTERHSEVLVLEDMLTRYVQSDRHSLSNFKASVDSIHDDFIRVCTGKALLEAFEILEHEVELDGEVLSGHNDARDRIVGLVREIDSVYHVGDVSEGDISSDNDFLEAYQEVKENRTINGGGIGFGVPALDIHIGGVSPGDLVLVGAYTGQGKTIFVCQMAWHAAVNQKKNVFFSTTETVRRQVHARIVARHSRLAKFNCAGGINSKHILKGTLSPAHEEVMKHVLEDLRTGDYGSILISQTPSDATLPFVESRITAWEQHTGKKPDLVILDSIYLLRSSRKRNSEREEFNDLLRDTKRLATALSVAIVSPWQITRSAWERALESGNGYGLSSFSDTSEAEKSASILVTLLRRPGEDDSLQVEVPKNRDGEDLSAQILYADYTNAYITDTMDAQTEGHFDGVDFL